MTSLRTDLVVHLHGPPLGEAPGMLFLHGLTDSGEGWPEAVAHWQRRFTIVAPDQRGHGESPRFTREQLRGHPGDLMVEDAVALLEQLPEPPVVIGHSLGGAVALTVAVRRPDLVRALVLEDPAPLGPHERQHSLVRGATHLAGVRRSMAALDDETLRRQRREDHPDWPESELLPTGRAEQRMDLEYLARGDIKPTIAWPELFATVTLPTLVVSGDDLKEVCVDDDMERGLAQIRNDHVRLVRVPGAGHCVRREQPAAYYELVDGWLERVLAEA